MSGAETEFSAREPGKSSLRITGYLREEHSRQTEQHIQRPRVKCKYGSSRTRMETNGWNREKDGKNRRQGQS